MLYRSLPPIPKAFSPSFLLSSGLGQLGTLGGSVSYQVRLGYESYLKGYPRDLISLIILFPGPTRRSNYFNELVSCQIYCIL